MIPSTRPEEAVRQLATATGQLQDQLGKVIVGQAEVVEQLLMALFSRGHCLLVGVPGLAKTLLVSTVSRILHLGFKRIQFTPDLMPADITGTDILQEDPQTGRRSFTFLKGPLFANMILADEINRTPPKTQAALLEAMQEHHVTAGSQTYHLPEPFFVLATQNPIEQEGTYPLPEAQLDRFMFLIKVGYPARDEEIEIMRRTTGNARVNLEPLLSGEQILALQEVVRSVNVGEHIFGYAADLVRATRPREPGVPKFVPELVGWGAGPRACQNLIVGGKARAILNGRVHVTVEDIRAVAYPVLRHRIVTTFSADAEGVTTDDIIKRLLAAIPAPQEAGGGAGEMRGTTTMTTTISIALGEEQAARLRALAQQAGVSPEDLVRREVEGMLTRGDSTLARPNEELVREVDYILRKNAELYKRLA